jgi:hypothetical protein
VIDPGQVEQLQRTTQALHPPAVAPSLQRGPVVERITPQLSLARIGIGGRTGHQAALEQLGMGAVVGTPGRDVDRHVADQAHSALRAVIAQRRPLALEADLVGNRPAPGEALPVGDPEALALTEGGDLPR